MTGRATERKAAPKAARNGSRVSVIVRAFSSRLGEAGPLAAILLLAGVLAACLLVAAELTTYRSIEVVTASCEELSRSAGSEVADDCVTTGGEQHGWALLPIAAVVALMAWGAGPGRSRPAGAALVVLGVVVLGIGLVGDLPHVDVTGAVGRNFDQATGHAGPALWLTFAGGALAVAAGGARLLARR